MIGSRPIWVLQECSTVRPVVLLGLMEHVNVPQIALRVDRLSRERILLMLLLCERKGRTIEDGVPSRSCNRVLLQLRIRHGLSVFARHQMISTGCVQVLEVRWLQFRSHAFLPSIPP